MELFAKIVNGSIINKKTFHIRLGSKYASEDSLTRKCQSDLQSKSIDWFLYDGNFCVQGVSLSTFILVPISNVFEKQFEKEKWSVGIIINKMRKFCLKTKKYKQYNSSDQS